MTVMTVQRRRILDELSASRSGPRRGTSLLRIGGSVAVVVALLLGGWFWWRSASYDPRIVEITTLQQDVQQRLFPSGEAARNPTSPQQIDEAMATMGMIREKMEALPEHLRPVARQQMGRMFFAGMQRQMDDYFQAPPAEKKAVLDQQIRQMEALRSAFGGQGGGMMGFAGGQGGQQAADRPRQAQSPWQAQSTEEARNAWRKRMIDGTSPEQRSRWTEYRDAVERRRGELGLPDAWRR